MDRKKLPIGISDYKLLVSEDYYYVDKTDFIRQIVEEGSLITLLPRPRRFGKTLNLSTLRYFFEKTEGNIYRPLFKGKSIESCVIDSYPVRRYGLRGYVSMPRACGRCRLSS